MASALAFGAPGIYPVPVQTGRALRGVRLDVCAFVGVTERGPARVPLFDETWRDDRPWVEASRPRRRSVAVAVDSWDAFRRLYGDGGPGHLPRSVEAFFRQGGRRAYVVRVVHRYALPADGHFDPVEAAPPPDQPEQPAPPRNDAGVAYGVVAGVRTSGGGDVHLTARDEGAWGNRLRAMMRFRAAPLGFVAATPGTLDLAYGTPFPAGTLLRLTLPGGARALRFATSVAEAWDAPSGARRLVAALDSPLPDVPVGVEVVEGVLDIDDGDGRREIHAALGLAFGHPRWAATTLCADSTLVWPHHAWAEDALLPLDAELAAPATASALIGTDGDPYRFSGGRDRYADLVPEDFFDARYVRGDEEPRDGVHALADVDEVALVALPDLYHPAPAVLTQPIVTPPSLAGPEFGECVPFVAAPPQAPPVPGLDGLLLDPRLPADLETIAALQRRVVDFAEERRRFIALLDVPPGLRPRRILDWRAHFDSAYAACYHPWLRVGDGDPRTPLPPSGVAAGLIARRELLFGLPHGPANELAADVVALHEPVPAPLHDTLHPQGVNVFQSERDGVRLTGARTLSRDPAWRQLSVRRLMTHLALLLEREMQWLVFEPHTLELRAQVRQMLRAYLRRLFAAGAFQGRSEDEAFFVRCDDELNPQRLVDLGQFVCEVGVAPAEPMEFLVLRIARDHDGGLTVTA